MHVRMGFEVSDGVAKLKRMGLVTCAGEGPDMTVQVRAGERGGAGWGFWDGKQGQRQGGGLLRAEAHKMSARWVTHIACPTAYAITTYISLSCPAQTGCVSVA